MARVQRRLSGAWRFLRAGLALALLLAGLDKFFDVLATWSMYLSPVAEKLLPVSGATALRAAGVVEMLLGLALLSRWTRVTAWHEAIAPSPSRSAAPDASSHAGSGRRGGGIAGPGRSPSGRIEEDVMKRLIVATMLSLAPLPALAATWNAVPLVDHNCEAKFKPDPDSHTTGCLLQCAKSGYGILENGTWLKLDREGNEKAVSALKATSRKDHVRVNVTGDRKGDLVHVRSLEIAA